VGFKGIIAATASVALMASPTIASAQRAAPAATEVTPAGETAGGTELRGGFIIPLIALIAIILGILAATQGHHDLPHSP
jgi:hypothetical protein